MARPDLDRYAWELQKAESETQRTAYLLEQLASFSAASSLQPVRADVTAFFDTKWSGKLNYETQRRVECGAGRLLKSSCKNDLERRLLVELISYSFPVFWQPLYIGVARNLNSRLFTHKRILNGSALGESGRDESETEDLQAARNLGERLKACSFRPEQLWVYTLAIDRSTVDLNEQRIRQIAEVAESWLNIFNTPKLGRA
jgi:hypothetical protein